MEKYEKQEQLHEKHTLAYVKKPQREAAPKRTLAYEKKARKKE